MIKRAIILTILVLMVTASLLQAVPQQYNEDNDPEALVDKARYCYNILEDYPRATKFLEQALNIAEQPHMQADILIRMAYVRFLMGKKLKDFRETVKRALKLDSRVNLSNVYYKRKFIDLVKMMKEKPQLESKKIQETVYRVDPITLSPAGSFFLSVGFKGIMLSDESYKEIYSGTTFIPEIKAGIQLAKYFYVWAGYSTISAEGTIPEIDEPATAKQNLLLAGFRYNRKFTKNLGWKIEAMAVSFNYQEEALDVVVKKKKFGYGVEAGLTYNFGKNFFSEVSAGYLYATDVEVDKEVKLGGVKGGLSLGIKF